MIIVISDMSVLKLDEHQSFANMFLSYSQYIDSNMYVASHYIKRYVCSMHVISLSLDVFPIDMQLRRWLLEVNNPNMGEIFFHAKFYF
jgi:hypothetical protein